MVLGEIAQNRRFNIVADHSHPIPFAEPADECGHDVIDLTDKVLVEGVGRAFGLLYQHNCGDVGLDRRKMRYFLPHLVLVKDEVFRLQPGDYIPTFVRNQHLERDKIGCDGYGCMPRGPGRILALFLRGVCALVKVHWYGQRALEGDSGFHRSTAGCDDSQNAGTSGYKKDGMSEVSVHNA